jgi:hypothetical protein
MPLALYTASNFGDGNGAMIVSAHWRHKAQNSD